MNHNHDKKTLCTSNCPRYDNLRISKEELGEARRISEMTVQELLAEMSDEQADALREAVVATEESTERNGKPTIDGSDWEGEPVLQVDARVTRWLHEFAMAEYRRGAEDGRSSSRETRRRLREELREKHAQLQRAKENQERAEAGERTALETLRQYTIRGGELDELRSRLQVIAELCNRDIGDPIGDRVEDLDVFARRMQRFAKEFIAREGFMGPNPERFADALIQYVTGRKPNDPAAR